MPEKNKSLGEQVSEQITKLIIENHWDVGDRLPSEYELARMLGGAEITETVIQSAREMKELAGRTKNN